MKKLVTMLLFVLMLLTNFCIYTGAENDEKLLSASSLTSAGEKWGYINEAGQFIIKPTYDSVSEFNDKGIAIVENQKQGDDYGDVYFINKSNKVVSGPFKSNIPEYQNGVAVLLTNNTKEQSIVVDELGKILLKSKYVLSNYSENLFTYYEPSKDTYGFMDIKGKIIIPAKYKDVQSFKDGKATVQVGQEKYSVIDKTGKVLETYNCYNYNSSEGLTPYYDTKGEKYGYKFYNGTIALTPKFISADRFTNGYAIISIPYGEYDQHYGIINKKGDYVVKPEYSAIVDLGQGLYSVTKNFNLFNNYYYAPKALMNIKGELLTDYKFTNILAFEGDYAVASNNTTTFFIDKNGDTVKTLPQSNGIGGMKINGDIIKAYIDGGFAYLNKNGDTIYQRNETIQFNNNININKLKYRRDFITYIEYPEITGMKDKTVQDSVNAKLKKYFINGYENNPVEIKVNTDLDAEPSEDENYEEVNVNFSAEQNKDLIIIGKYGYWFPIGAAHGQPTQDYYYIDTKTGVFYQLKDLFNSNSNYAQKLTSIVSNQFNLNKRIGEISGEFGYLVDKVSVSSNQPFMLGKDSLKVYYTPYEIACYAAGFPEFEIPYGQLTSIINTKGAFWNSFDKTIVNKKINILSYGINSSTATSLENVIGSYEKNIIEAINTNKFSKVEGCLLNGSNLYNSQKKLVYNLYKKNTKEKLTKFDIYALTFDSTSNEYKAFVQEEVAIKYSGKSYVNKKFSWCYTIKADSAGNFKLTDICKW